MTPEIRVAGLADVARLVQLSRETFTDTFGHLYPPEDLAHFLDESYTPAAWTGLLNDASMRTWIAEEALENGSELIGYALAGPCKLPHPEVSESAGELKRLYVSRSRIGSGVGRVLFEEALRWLEARGRKPVWISVYSENHRALKFYERWGFKQVGEYEYVVGRSRDRELILRRDASPRRSE
jgi:diamine N-acetyltransferase